MLKSAFRAFGDLFSPEFRSVLFLALGMTIALFIAVLVIAELLIASFTHFSWPWADRLVEVGSGLVLLVAFATVTTVSWVAALVVCGPSVAYLAAVVRLEQAQRERAVKVRHLPVIEPPSRRVEPPADVRATVAQPG